MADTKPKGYTNPALQAMGIRQLRLPSRNWSIFWTVVAVFGGGVLYDRSEQKKNRQKWMELVQPLGEVKYSSNEVPRKLTVFITPSPNDFLEESMKFFRKNVKPVLNAGSVDYEVFTESKQGEIRSNVAERIRNLRRAYAEKSPSKAETPTREIKAIPAFFNKKVEDDEPTKKVSELYETRQVLGINYGKSETMKLEYEDNEVDLSKVGGVICIGRGAYIEYVRGVHEGLLGPLEAPEPTAPITEIPSPEDPTAVKSLDEIPSAEPVKASDDDDDDDDKIIVPPPYITGAQYGAAELAPEFDFTRPIIDPVTKTPVFFQQPVYVFKLPNIAGFKNVPHKMYNFYTRRNLVDECGEKTAAIVLNTTREFVNRDEYMGKDEEVNWPKKWVAKGVEKNSEWVQELKFDDRITEKWNVFDPKLLQIDSETGKLAEN